MDKLVAAKYLQQPVKAFAMNKYMSHFCCKKRVKITTAFCQRLKKQGFCLRNMKPQKSFMSLLIELVLQTLSALGLMMMPSLGISKQ